MAGSVGGSSILFYGAFDVNMELNLGNCLYTLRSSPPHGNEGMGKWDYYDDSFRFCLNGGTVGP